MDTLILECVRFWDLNPKMYIVNLPKRYHTNAMKTGHCGTSKKAPSIP